MEKKPSASVVVTVEVAGMLACRIPLSFVIPPAPAKLTPELVMGLVKQTALKAMPGVSVRDMEALRLKLDALREE